MWRNSRKVICFLIVMSLLVVLASAAYAGKSTGGTGTGGSSSAGSLQDRLAQAPDFLFRHQKNGIGCGYCPVYTAPSLDAFRCANDKAGCDTNAYVDEAGKDRSGWLLVRYETNGGGSRVGYIPPSYVRGFKSDMEFPVFDYIPATATDTIYVTDNLYLHNSSFATLDAGETFYILGKYTYLKNPTFWYIECYVDGKLSRGFIDRESASFVLGEGNTGSIVPSPTEKKEYSLNPSKSPLGTSQDGWFRLYDTDERKNVRQRADKTSEIVSHVYNSVLYPCYGSQTGADNKTWYYIWVETDSQWGWVSGSLGYLSY